MNYIWFSFHFFFVVSVRLSTVKWTPFFPQFLCHCRRWQRWQWRRPPHRESIIWGVEFVEGETHMTNECFRIISALLRHTRAHVTRWEMRVKQNDTRSWDFRLSLCVWHTPTRLLLFIIIIACSLFNHDGYLFRMWYTKGTRTHARTRPQRHDTPHRLTARRKEETENGKQMVCLRIGRFKWK